MDKEETKSRGLKHRTGKKKYNNKHVHVAPVQPKPKDSNWDRYEQKEEEPKISSSTDFSVLASAPITHGSHFQFKSDKDSWDLPEGITSPLFNLDLTILEKSLGTLPFNIRSGISDDYFTEEQKKVMTALNDNVKDYQSYLQTRKSKHPDVIFGSESEWCDSDGSEVPQSEPSAESAPQAPPDDLEQWLDDILDD